MTLVDITTKVSRNEPLLRLYDKKICINAPASAVLGLQEGDSLSFKVNERAENPHLFVGKEKEARRCYPVKRRANTFVVNDSHLARSLAERLQGVGTYRISKEDHVEYNGVVYYNIFFRKYD